MRNFKEGKHAELIFSVPGTETVITEVFTLISISHSNIMPFPYVFYYCSCVLHCFIIHEGMNTSGRN